MPTHDRRRSDAGGADKELPAIHGQILPERRGKVGGFEPGLFGFGFFGDGEVGAEVSAGEGDILGDVLPAFGEAGAFVPVDGAVGDEIGFLVAEFGAGWREKRAA